jgi:hypothetical protein
MGVFDWLVGKKPTPTAQVVREKLAGLVAARDVIGIATVASALDGSGATVVGITTTDFPGRDDVRNEVFDALRVRLPELDHDQCLAVFCIVLRAMLPVDVTGRRERWGAERSAIAADICARLDALIDTASATQLVETCDALRRRSNGTVVLGIHIPHFDWLREQLETHALVRLRGLVPALEGNDGRRVLLSIRNSNLDVEVGRRLAELDDTHRADVRAALAVISDEPRNLELEAALDSDDPAAFAVLADWLAERDHPRGALIALQLRAESDHALEPAVAKHIADHAITLLGELAMSDVLRAEPAFAWKRGFIDAARLTIADAASQSPHTLAALLQLLLAHGSARRLRELRLGLNGSNDAGLAELVEILGAKRPALRKLVVGEFTREQSELSWFVVGSIAPVWQLPELRELVVRGAEIELGTIEHAKLERLVIEAGGLPRAAARALAAAQLPSLRHLDISCGDRAYGTTAELDDVRRLLERSDFPALVHLGLKNTTMSDAICALLPSSPLAAQLTSLDLSLGTLTSVGARALIANKQAFRNLASIDISATYVDAAANVALGSAFPRAVVSLDMRRDPGPGDRYVSINE